MDNNISALVKDGKIQSTTASSLSLSAEKTKASSDLDKDAFLQLLVAQMKYQDPMEPTENTEYISQLATFSELEEMQNMTAQTSLQRASGLVGEEVICKVVNPSTGKADYTSGVVDYVVYENSKAFVSIADELYSVDDVYEVKDPLYSEAFDLSQKFKKALSTLPDKNNLTLDEEESVASLRTVYDSMTKYQKTFIPTDIIETLSAYENKIKELRLASNATESNEA